MNQKNQKIAVPEHVSLTVPELEEILDKGKTYLDERKSDVEYRGKLFEANFAGFYELYTRNGVKSHEDALKESYALCQNLVELNRCNEYGSEARFGGAKMTHPTYVKIVGEFNAILEKYTTEIKAMKDSAGYTVAIYPKIVNKEKAEKYKNGNK